MPLLKTFVPEKIPKVSESSNAITVPNIDWTSNAEAVAAERSEKDDSERSKRNLAGPSKSDIERSRSDAPKAPDHHSPGDTERADGGEVITWVSDKCFYTTRGIDLEGTTWTIKVCKDPEKANSEMFESIRKKLDENISQQTP